MQFTPQQLTDKLLGALDKDCNVVDMRLVLEVMAILEAYPITKENLEQTRVGRYVNDMRRKTQNKELARRAKRLVKKWKECIDSSSTPVRTNGERIATGLPMHVHDAQISSKSGVKPNSPLNIRLSDRIKSPKIGSRPATPHSPHSAVLSSTSENGIRERGHISTPPSPAIGSSKLSPNLPAKSSQVNEPSQDGNCYPKIRNAQPEVTSKTSSANKKRRRTCSPSIVPHKRNCTDGRHIVNNVCKANGLYSSDRKPVTVNHVSADTVNDKQLISRFVTDKGRPVVKPQKVKTTAQLLQDVSSKSGVKLVNSETAAKIVNNEINKEPDVIDQSVVPLEARPRQRRKVASTPQVSGSFSKNELVQKFLDTSVSPNAQELGDALTENSVGGKETNEVIVIDDADETAYDRLGAHKSENVQSTAKSSTSDMKDVCGAMPLQLQPKSPLVESVDPWKLLPNINPEEIDWTSHEYTPTQPAEATNTNLDRLQSSHWNGVNGHLDANGAFREWKDMYTEQGTDGHLLHILPYVTLD